MRTRDFRDLVVWQRAGTLVRASYVLAARLPVEERFGLASQIRRAASSIPANIAEGHARAHRREFLQFLAIAHASAKELDSHLLLCESVGYVDGGAIAPALALSDEVSRMLRAMRRTLGCASPPRSTLHAPGVQRGGRSGDAQHTDRRKRSQS